MAWVRCIGGGTKLPRNYLFKDGVLGIGISPTGYRPSNWTGAVSRQSTYTITNNQLVLTMTTTSGGGCTWFTDPIDVTDVNSITFTIDSKTADMGNNIRALMSSQFQDLYSYVSNTPCSAVGTYSVDTSALTGMYRFGITINAPVTSTNPTLKINEIYMNV